MTKGVPFQKEIEIVKIYSIGIKYSMFELDVNTQFLLLA